MVQHKQAILTAKLKRVGMSKWRQPASIKASERMSVV